MAKKYVSSCKVLKNEALNPTNFHILLGFDQLLPQIVPGQFVNIEIQNEKNVFLRRPFSVFDVDFSKNTLSILVKILGKGSKALTQVQPGTELNLIYPLGKGFTMPGSADLILLVGGGSGVAPMLYLAKESGLAPENVHIILGAKTKEDHIDAQNYSKYANLHFTTEDGSLGEKGYVVQHSVFRSNLNKFTKIYACGPSGMMKAVAAEAHAKNLFCEVSLENLMACGFGVCLCCIEPTAEGNLCICTEGPVFNINLLKWQI